VRDSGSGERQARRDKPLARARNAVFGKPSPGLAEPLRMLAEGGPTPEARIEYAWRRVLARPPSARETSVASSALKRFEAHYQADAPAAIDLLNQGDSSWNRSMDAAELAAYSSVASLILNLDETVTKP